MKIELHQALRLWQKEQSPNYKKFLKWLKGKDLEIPPEGSRWNPKIWTTGTCEEGVCNPDFKDLRCGRIELMKQGMDYPHEYSICLPAELWDEISDILENY